MELRSKSTLFSNIPYTASGWDSRLEKKRLGRRKKNATNRRNFEFTNPNFAYDFLSELYQLYQEGVCCDVVLSSGDYQTSAHKVVLVASSEYFKSLFTSSDSAKDFVVLPSDISSEALKLVLSYMYTGLLCLNPDNILSVLCAASRLQIRAAISLCNEFFSCNGTNLDSSLPLLSSGLSFHLDQVNDIVIKEELSGIDEAEFENKVASDFLDVNVFDGSISGNNIENEVEELQIVSHKRKTKSRLHQQNDDDELIDPCQTIKSEVSGSVVVDDQGILEARRSFSRASLSAARSKLKSGSRKRSSKSVMCTSKSRKRRGPYSRTRKVYRVLKKPGSRNKVVTLGQNLLATGTAFMCHICSAGFSKYSGLMLHLKFRHEVSVNSVAAKLCRHLLKLVAQQDRRRTFFESQISTRSESDGLKFVCCTCKHEFSLRANFLSHLMKHYSSTDPRLHQHHKHPSLLTASLAKQNRFLRPRVYRCRYCKRPFVHRSTMSSHCLVNHKRIKSEEFDGDKAPKTRQARVNWSCKEIDCDVLCSCLQDLKKHMASRHPDVIYSCPDCRFSCQVDRIFQRHRNQRHGRKQVCHLCGKTCRKLSLLKQHMYVHHRVKDPTLKLYQCAYEGCTYECCSKNRLADHCSRHNLDKSLKCEECGKAFKHSLGLNKHISAIHQGVRPFICDQCAMAFGSESALKAHVARHAKNKPYACSQCSYRTCAKVNLRYHLFSRHQIQTGLKEQQPMILHCDQCDFTTSRKGRLEDHMKKHRNIRDIPCPECGKLFITKKNLYGHTVTVHRPKTLRCTYCNYSSALLSAFKDHVRIMHTHRHEKRYECPLCRFRSATSGNCRKHIQRTHKEFGINPKYVGAPRKSDFARAEREDFVMNEEDGDGDTLNLSCKGMGVCGENE